MQKRYFIAKHFKDRVGPNIIRAERSEQEVDRKNIRTCPLTSRAIRRGATHVSARLVAFTLFSQAEGSG